MKPPDLERAFVRPEKITRYLLSEAHPVGRYKPGRVRIAYLYPDAGHDGTRCVPYGGTWRITGGCRRLLALEFGMKRSQLIKHLNAHGAFLLREGSGHSIYQLGHNKTQVPRHNEIVDELARKICKDLGIPFVR